VTEAGQHHKISVESNALKAANTKRRKPVLILEPTELALHGAAAPSGLERFANLS
jgi:hypothetical protein